MKSDLNGALDTINQSIRLVEKSISDAKVSLNELYEEQQESIVIFEANHNNFMDLKQDKDDFVATRLDLESMVDYLLEAKRFIINMRDEIVKGKRQSESKN